jgi:predicted glycoside hydrolase/deacetylase ChbG (UPF0249 family)
LGCLIAGAGDKVATVGEKTGRYDAHITIHSSYPLVRTWLEELAADKLLESEYDAILALDADRCATVLDRLDRVFDLEVPTIGGEDRVGQVVARTY